MKFTRTLMLSLGLAVATGAASAEPAVAQCWDCQWGHLRDSEGDLCYNCTAGQTGVGVTECSTPACNRCYIDGDTCFVIVMLDGRTAPAEPIPVTTLDPQAFSAVYGSTWPIAHPRRAGETKRSCDGGILTKSYAATDENVIRSKMAQLRL